MEPWEDRIQALADAWIEWESLLEKKVWPTQIRLATRPESPEEFGDPRFISVESINMDCRDITDEDLIVLASSSYTKNLKWISLDCCSITKDCVVKLCKEGSHIPCGLEWFYLGGNPFKVHPYLDGVPFEDKILTLRIPRAGRDFLEELGKDFPFEKLQWLHLGDKVLLEEFYSHGMHLDQYYEIFTYGGHQEWRWDV